MQGILTVLTDGRCELAAVAENGERGNVCVCAAFIGSHLAAGQWPPAGRTARADHVSLMQSQGSEIARMAGSA